MEATHKQLLSVCIGIKNYWKKTKHILGVKKGLNDCSCGCEYYHELSGESVSKDWGICWNKKSPRAGKLTFEHMERCKFFKEDKIVEKTIESFLQGEKNDNRSRKNKKHYWSPA